MKENWIRHQSHTSFFKIFCQASHYFKQHHNQTSGVRNKHIPTNDKLPKLLFINDIIAASQQDNYFKNDHSNDFWFNFEPRIQSGWHIPIFSTLSSCAAVIHHWRNIINLSPCRPCRLGARRQTCLIFQKTTDTIEAPSFIFPAIKMADLSMFTLSIKANSWIGLQYFLNYFNGLVIGRLGTGEKIES